METMYYIGLDVHKKTISYCVKDEDAGFMTASFAKPESKLPNSAY